MGYRITVRASLNGTLDDALDIARFIEEMSRIRPDLVIQNLDVSDESGVPF